MLFFLIVGSTSVFAQYFSFGKNRVQYNQFDWRYIQSEHFDIYYYQSLNYELADFTALVLESALKQLSEDFDHQIADRIRVIIYDSHNDFSQTNVIALPEDAEGIGGVTDLYKNRITIPFSGNYTEFRSTLHHELIHATFNDLFYGGSIQSVISSGFDLLLPDWFDEGLSEYESLGWDTNTDMWIRDAVINDYLPNIPQLGGYFAYRGGQSVWNYIVETYGRQKIPEIIQTIKERRSVEAGFQEALGLSISELNDRWKSFYRRRYLPEVAERENITEFASHITDWTTSYTYNTSPAISPQGDKIAMITNDRGYFDVVVVSAITGEKLKTLIKGSDNVNFEELNILNPNLSWSPDGEKLTLSAKSKGADDLAIVDYTTGTIRKIKFPKLDAIGSVAWSPDGQKIAFDGNIGPAQDIFVFNLETQQLFNITNDIISDFEPAWSSDSQSIYFVSTRGDKLELNKYKNNRELLMSDDLYTTDIYRVQLKSSSVTRLTRTPLWSEKQPATTRDGRLIYISDQNGIPNIYLMDIQDRIVSPLTDLQSGVLQMSISADGSRLAVNAVDEGSLDIFVIQSPFERLREVDLIANEWANRRKRESQSRRVPATNYVRQMFSPQPSAADSISIAMHAEPPAQDEDTEESQQDTTEAAIDIRNYVFSMHVEEDTTLQDPETQKFTLLDNKTEDGRYIPKEYRVNFSLDILYAGGTFSTSYYNTYGVVQAVFSDLLGDHKIAMGSDFVLNLTDSNYYLSYGYLKERTNWLFSFLHSSASYQTYSGQLYRFRSLGGTVAAQYPIDKFRRLDVGVSGLSISRNYTITGFNIAEQERSTFMYPEAVYTVDKTLFGYVAPIGGHRYALSLSGSPPLFGGNLAFVSLLADYRKYFNMGYGYSFAVRSSGAASLGRDSQTYFMGGMLGWINSRWSGYSLPFDELENAFFTQPALPLRGYEYNSIYGDKFSLVNMEFRFPLFAAVLPGPIPFIPLYNMTGVAFFDAGMAWGQDIPLEFINRRTGTLTTTILNEADLDFKVAEPVEYYITDDGQLVSGTPPPNAVSRFISTEGDVLIGAGFGLRTILLGFPIRYDVGWPYYRDGFGKKPIHYFTIALDF